MSLAAISEETESKTWTLRKDKDWSGSMKIEAHRGHPEIRVLTTGVLKVDLEGLELIRSTMRQALAWTMSVREHVSPAVDNTSKTGGDEECVD